MTDTEPKDPGPVFSRREFLALSGSAALSGLTPPCGAAIGAPETGPGGRLGGSIPVPDEAFWEQLRSRFAVRHIAENEFDFV